MRGHAAPAAQIPDPPTIGYREDLKRLPYDPAKAKELLKEAGFEKGFEVTLTGPNDRYIQDANIAEAVAKYLAKVGITARLDVKPKSIFFPEVSEGKLEFYSSAGSTAPSTWAGPILNWPTPGIRQKAMAS